MPLAALCLAFLVPPDAAPVRLARRFAANEKLAYAFNGHITTERRVRGLETWLPEDEDVAYNYTLQVESLKNEGFALVRQQMPSITFTEGETYDSLPKPHVYKYNTNWLMTLSPINEVTELVDQTPKPKKKGNVNAMFRGQGVQINPAVFLPYVQEVHSLALFVRSLDVAPPFPLEPAKVGDTWQRTVGYQPQKLKGKEGKAAVQRLDCTYTYLGAAKSDDGKPVLKVQGKLRLDTDLGEFVRSLVADSGEDRDPMVKTAVSKLKMPLNLNATIDFDLDPKTLTTLGVYATSEGNFQQRTQETGAADYEERFKGRTTLRLIGRKIVTPTKPLRQKRKPGA